MSAPYPEVIVYSAKTCPYCVRAKELLKLNDIPFKEILVDEQPELRKTMEQLSGRRTVPQIFIGKRHVGGYDDLKALHDSGELKTWLEVE